MKCTNCGFEYEQRFEYCPNCGTATKKEYNSADYNKVEAVSINPVADRVMGVLNDKLFLWLCILMTVSSGLSLILGNIPVINILITIFLWLTYSESKKGFVNHNHLRGISGTVYASYVITNVVLIICIVGVVISAFAIISLADTNQFNYVLQEALAELDIDLLNFDLSKEVVSIALTAMMFGLIIGLVFALVINLLGLRKIHRFVKSVYTGVMLQNPKFENVRAAKNWIMFFGVINALSTGMLLVSGDIAAVIATGSASAATIIAAVLINRHLMTPDYF